MAGAYKKPVAPKKPTPKSAIKNSESILKKKVATGKVKDLNATRKSIAKKTGVWPMEKQTNGKGNGL